jgi:two-component system cell cycle response regulator DivK
MHTHLILIVEDDANSRKLLRDALQVTGYETLEAVSGEQGLSLAIEHRPALVLMDIQLPGINGVEALRRLRAEPATRAIPVIAVTASVMNTQRAEFQTAGFDGIEFKPVSVAGLLRRMRDLIDAQNSATERP